MHLFNRFTDIGKQALESQDALKNTDTVLCVVPARFTPNMNIIGFAKCTTGEAPIANSKKGQMLQQRYNNSHCSSRQEILILNQLL